MFQSSLSTSNDGSRPSDTQTESSNSTSSHNSSDTVANQSNNKCEESKCKSAHNTSEPRSKGKSSKSHKHVSIYYHLHYFATWNFVLLFSVVLCCLL